MHDCENNKNTRQTNYSNSEIVAQLSNFVQITMKYFILENEKLNYFNEDYDNSDKRNHSWSGV